MAFDHIKIHDFTMRCYLESFEDIQIGGLYMNIFERISPQRAPCHRLGATFALHGVPHGTHSHPSTFTVTRG